jgi:hypothetical protein
MQCLVRADQKLTLSKAAVGWQISIVPCWAILTYDLCIKHFSLLFFPWLWTTGQKEHHLSVICVETWVYCYGPKTKQQSSQWKISSPPQPKTTCQVHSKTKVILIIFFMMEVLCAMTVLHKAKLCTSIFLTSAKVIHSTVNNQENGSLAHGRFKMTVHWHTWPKLCSSCSQKETFHKCVNPHTPQTWSHVPFSSTWIRNTLKDKQFQDVKTIKLKVTSRDA